MQVWLYDRLPHLGKKNFFFNALASRRAAAAAAQPTAPKEAPTVQLSAYMPSAPQMYGRASREGELLHMVSWV